MEYDLGKVALTNGGNWKSNVAYERLTYVLYDAEDGGDGCGYISLKDNVGKTPGADPTAWAKAAQAGQSIYQLCVAHGAFVGTEEEFVAAYNAAVQLAHDQGEAAQTAAGRANDAADNAGRLIREVNAAFELWAQAERDRAAAEEQRQLNETNRQTEFERQMAASETATDLSGRATQMAQEATRDANNAAAAANDAARTTMQMNAGLIGLGVKDGSLVLFQNAESGTVTGGEIDSDGMVHLTFSDEEPQEENDED